MRVAELLAAVILGVFSVGIMVKSAELPIGWISEEGPGGGAFPFWLGAGMLVCCAWIFVKTLRRRTGDEGQAEAAGQEAEVAGQDRAADALEVAENPATGEEAEAGERADAPDGAYMNRPQLIAFAQAAGSLAVMIFLVHIIGVYFAVPLFLLFYLRFLGGHSWRLTSSVAAAMPVITFFFFEVGLTITLPKGYTEPLFYPLYDLFL